MHTDARVGVVVEDSRQRALSSGHGGGGVGDGKQMYSTQQKSQTPKQRLQHQPQIGTAEHLIAGGVAGAVSKTCTAPLARLTILFQVQGMHADVATLKNASIWREASRIVSEEGLRAFWKGNLVTIAHRLPYSSLNFYTYERYKGLLQMIPGLDKRRDNVAADVCVRLFAGGLAGITAASATYPLDLVRTRLAAQTRTMYYRGMSHALYTICRDEGMRGLYKGIGATLLGVGPSIAISFSVYETLRSCWQVERPHDSPVLVSLACGSLSGIASSTATFPLDLVRRRMQLEGAGGRAHVYTSGLIGTFRHIVRIEGIRGLYRGILPEYFKVVPSVGIVFMTYETLKMILSRRSTAE
ncbi:mitochondrial substrate carrier family protein B-like isoform X1 [Zingiber officinale]|uniref:mitochondrial substrate carrier family protein B-like isoform X1 n=1 Tax=Zingiber officinale TaxID=94328 RepID=UPI001C4AFC52|nr:mitochondrial substrate carrier family protein B-like isoform X1 [Zingiber officinale]XP_042451392.1 mitochondrial substrate carrier family protein B-like isoform X1 [Zingiber officinale]